MVHALKGRCDIGGAEGLVSGEGEVVVCATSSRVSKCNLGQVDDINEL